MATNFNLTPRPKLTPVLDGKRVIFAREADLVDAPEGDEPEADSPDVDVPGPTDVKADWIDFAVSQGMDRAEAEAKTKQELVDEFGG
jgi:hypothetical protein